jgi:hypothetical protein
MTEVENVNDENKPVPNSGVTLNLMSNNSVANTDPVAQYLYRQLTIDNLGLDNMIVLRPPDINPVLLRRYAMTIPRGTTSGRTNQIYYSDSSDSSNSDLEDRDKRFDKKKTHIRRPLRNRGGKVTVNPTDQ